MPRACKKDHIYDPRNCATCRSWRGIADTTTESEELAGLQKHVRCQNLGEATGELVDCPTCVGHVQLKLFHCVVHGSCTLARKVPGTACCGSGCNAYVPAGQRTSAPLYQARDNPAIQVEDPLPERPAHTFTRTADRDRHNQAFRSLQARLTVRAPSLPAQGDGVLLVGGGRYWPGIVVAVRMLRAVGCQLPVQVWYRGQEEPVHPEDLNDPLVSYHDTTTYPHRRLGGWEAKSLALLYCGWERVLYLDADAYCVTDPTPMLECVNEDCPFAFWSDLPNTDKNVKWEWQPVKNSQEVPPIQGGQLFFHRPGFVRELLLAHWLNQHSDYYYSKQFGDQDSWRVALAATDGPYRVLGTASWRRIAFVCEYEQQAAVVHRCQAKMMTQRDLVSDTSLPGEPQAVGFFQEFLHSGPPARVFGRIYRDKDWGEGSGCGSYPAAAADYLRVINALLSLDNWKSVVDLGIGDGRIVSQLQSLQVTGVDCCQSMVDAQKERQPDRTWLCLDLLADREQLPAGELVLIKDVLQHWPSAVVEDWLSWAVNSGKWRDLLLTNDADQQNERQDCLLGGFRPLSARMYPLSSFSPQVVARYGRKEILRIRCRPVAV